MPELDTYLFFDGTCAEAMRFYERVLGGQMQAMMRYSESPEQDAQCPAGAQDLVMHACLLVGERRLMASDVPASHGGVPARGGFGVALGYESPDDARRVFDALSQGGTVTMPMQKTFWTETFGMLTDRFGTPWMVGGGPQKPA